MDQGGKLVVCSYDRTVDFDEDCVATNVILKSGMFEHKIYVNASEDAPPEVIENFEIVPEGQDYIIVKMFRGNEESYLLAGHNVSYPVVVIDGKRNVQDATGKLIYDGIGFYVSYTSPLIGKLLVLMGQDYRIYSYDVLPSFSLPTFCHSYNPRKMRGVILNNKFINSSRKIVCKAVRMGAYVYASILNYEYTKVVKRCDGCAVCHNKNCTYLPLFRIPQHCFGNYVFEFYNFKKMPAPYLREMGVKRMMDMPLQLDRNDFSYYSTNQVVDTVEAYSRVFYSTCLNSLATGAFEGIYGPVRRNSVCYLRSTYVDYHLCEMIESKRQAAIVTSSLFGIDFLPCGRRLMFAAQRGPHNSGVTDLGVRADSACIKGVSIVSVGSSQVVLNGSWGEVLQNAPIDSYVVETLRDSSESLYHLEAREILNLNYHLVVTTRNDDIYGWQF
jgi:hypothetical protein